MSQLLMFVFAGNPYLWSLHTSSNNNNNTIDNNNNNNSLL